MPSISAFWGDRRIDQNAAAELLGDVLTGLQRVDPGFSTWRPKASSKSEAGDGSVIPADSSSIVQHLRPQKTDFGGGELPQLGFSFSAWSEMDGGCSISATVGLHAANANLTNSVVLDLPDSWERADGRITEIVDLLRSIADPDRVAYFDHSAQEVIWSRPTGKRWRRFFN